MRDSLKRLLVIPTALALGLSLSPVASAQPAPEAAVDPNPAPVPGLGQAIEQYVDPGAPEDLTPVRVEDKDVRGLPAGVSVDRVEWINNRRISVFIKSAVMPDRLQQVQILLARDWHSNPTATFPEIWALDGLRMHKGDNGWTTATNMVEFYADKNVNIILPIGADVSFFSDWQQPANNTHYKWETFLIDELIPILNKGFRSNGHRSVMGISMGATGAVNLAGRNPGVFDAVGSFSGYLDTTSPGMPAMIDISLLHTGKVSAKRMWGPVTHPDWDAHDPKQLIDNLRGTALYISAGTGVSDYGQPDGLARKQPTIVGESFEVISRLTSQTFVNRAKRQGVPVTAKFRNAGVHTWEYWQFESQQAWPLMADAMGVDESGRGVTCQAVGAIANVVSNGALGSCINNEYDVNRGKAQDFHKGTAYWAPDTGAHVLYGRINGRYSELGGPNSWLGFPTSTEFGTPDGRGRFARFEHGHIYWHPEVANMDAIPVREDFQDAWGTTGWETGPLGYPVAALEEADGRATQRFQNGSIVKESNGDMVLRRADGSEISRIAAPPAPPAPPAPEAREAAQPADAPASEVPAPPAGAPEAPAPDAPAPEVPAAVGAPAAPGAGDAPAAPAAPAAEPAPAAPAPQDPASPEPPAAAGPEAPVARPEEES